MAEMATSIPMQQSSRIRALTFPREHGAWGLLVIPLVTGACIGIPAARGLSDLLLFTVAALSIFWLRTPLESFFGMGLLRIGNDEERSAVLHTIAYLAPVALAAVAGLLWGGRNLPLVLLGLIGGTAFALQAAMRLFGRRMRMLSQAVGSLGLTSTAAGAYYALTGHLDERALAVWFACWLFAGDQIHYVQLRLRYSRIQSAAKRFIVARNFLGGQVLMLVVIGAAAKIALLPAYALVAFLPVVLRGFLWITDKKTELELHWLGMSELLQGVVFGTLLIVTFLV